MSEMKTVALVTGASSGLGAEYCRQLASRCDVIIATGRRLDRLEELAQSLRSEVEMHCIAADLATVEGVTRVVECLRQKGPVDYLINNAGFGWFGVFSETDLDAQLNMVRVHVDAPMTLCRAALPFMRERGRGWVINVSSMGSFMPLSRNAVYTATKVFLNNFSEAVALEEAKFGIRVQALCPGYVRTEIHSRDTMQGFDAERVPAEQWMEVEEVVAESLAALELDTVVVVPGAANREMVAMLKTAATS